MINNEKFLEIYDWDIEKEHDEDACREYIEDCDCEATTYTYYWKRKDGTNKGSFWSDVKLDDEGVKRMILEKTK